MFLTFQGTNFEISTKWLQKLSNVFSGENFSAVDEFVTVLMLLGVSETAILIKCGVGLGQVVLVSRENRL